MMTKAALLLAVVAVAAAAAAAGARAERVCGGGGRAMDAVVGYSFTMNAGDALTKLPAAVASPGAASAGLNDNSQRGARFAELSLGARRGVTLEGEMAIKGALDLEENLDVDKVKSGGVTVPSTYTHVLHGPRKVRLAAEWPGLAEPKNSYLIKSRMKWVRVPSLHGSVGLLARDKKSWIFVKVNRQGKVPVHEFVTGNVFDLRIKLRQPGGKPSVFRNLHREWVVNPTTGKNSIAVFARVVRVPLSFRPGTSMPKPCLSALEVCKLIQKYFKAPLVDPTTSVRPVTTNVWRQMMCAGFHESRYRPLTKQHEENPNKSQDVGLFQVNSVHWIDYYRKFHAAEYASSWPKTRKTCHRDFAWRNADCLKIATILQKGWENARAARYVYDLQGIEAWKAYTNHCKGTYTQEKFKCEVVSGKTVVGVPGDTEWGKLLRWQE